ncbi:MAG: hypothetical protein SAK29_40320 [Scytonema sp. PMC 1069.18]|nr:hypothetical protein [Scytonema sp. PMC 1069.18]MEC4881108.1 hypothetical protein [Scytonema sp. PMC 1070.18]
MTWVSGQKLDRDKYEIKQELGWGRFPMFWLQQPMRYDKDGLWRRRYLKSKPLSKIMS